jgi:hypothetical protein
MAREQGGQFDPKRGGQSPQRPNQPQDRNPSRERQDTDREQQRRKQDDEEEEEEES